MTRLAFVLLLTGSVHGEPYHPCPDVEVHFTFDSLGVWHDSVDYDPEC